MRGGQALRAPRALLPLFGFPWIVSSIRLDEFRVQVADNGIRLHLINILPVEHWRSVFCIQELILQDGKPLFREFINDLPVLFCGMNTDNAFQRRSVENQLKRFFPDRGGRGKLLLECHHAPPLIVRTGFVSTPVAFKFVRVIVTSRVGLSLLTKLESATA